MEDVKLKIESKKYRDESVVITSRLPKDMLEEIDRIANDSARTRNEIVQILLEFALKNVEVE
ncbi:MAG: ribbon-helix-helix protein, CopG family [Spirochaetales bacterium]|nr:ribbon-helix-helix protein, CopG family [Spirochaetales bacterium]